MRNECKRHLVETQDTIDTAEEIIRNRKAIRKELVKQKETLTQKCRNLDEENSRKPKTETTIEAVEQELRTLQMDEKERFQELTDKIQKQDTEIRFNSEVLRTHGYSDETVFDGVSYTDVDVDTLERQADGLRMDCDDLESDVSNLRDREHDAEMVYNQQKGRLNGRDPLPYMEIHGDYMARMDRCEKERSRILDRRYQVRDRIALYSDVAHKLESFGDRGAVEPSYLESVTLPLNLAEDTKNKLDEYRKAQNTFNDSKRKLENKYRDMNRLVEQDDALKCKFPPEPAYLTTDETLTRELLDRFMREFNANVEAVSRLKVLLENSLAALDQRKATIYANVTEYAGSIYSGLRRMFESSYMVIGSRKKRLLECDAFKEEYKPEHSEAYMTAYLDEVVSRMVEMYKSGKDDKDIHAALVKAMAPAQIMRKYINQQRLYFRVFKFEANDKNSRYVDWETSVSGGESNVAAFIVALAKLKYLTMDAEKEAHGITNWSVLWLDNPFAKSTAAHLLKPIYEMAALHNIQLVVLSGIKNSGQA